MKSLSFIVALVAACSGEAPTQESNAPSPLQESPPRQEADLIPQDPTVTASPEPEAVAEVPAEAASDEAPGASDEERAAAAALAAELMNEVAEETGTPQNEVDSLIQGITNSAPTATDEDRRARPRSARRGRPDVASSCNTISFVAECMETARTATGQGYRSTESMCVNGIWSTTDPCPEAGRTGTCRITDDQQVVHYYYTAERHPDPVEHARSVCESYHGEFFTRRTHPLNGG